MVVATLLYSLPLCDFIFGIKSHSDSWLNRACLFLKSTGFKKMGGDHVLLLKNVVFLVI